MPQQTFECEVITPLFLGGADARGVPELRAPSMRGAMRYWYRALLGGAKLPGELALHALHSIESDLFGEAEGGGTLATRLRTKGTQPIQPYERDRAIRTPDGDFLPTGKDYLLWSMSSTGKPGTHRSQPARQYIEPGTMFDIILSATLDKTALKKGEAAFWLLANLGAVGARANRGAGSFHATSNDSPIPFKTTASISDLQNYLHAGIAACLKQAGLVYQQELSQVEFDILHPDVCEICIVADASKGWDSYRSALEGLGSRFRDYRTHTKPKGVGRNDHDAVLKWFEQGGQGPILKRPIFGLPIPFRYSQGGPSDVIVHQDGDRRGSPLHIKITRLSSGQYVGILILFKSRFLPLDTVLKLQERRWTAPAPPDYDVIRDFIKTFPVQEEVPL